MRRHRLSRCGRTSRRQTPAGVFKRPGWRPLYWRMTAGSLQRIAVAYMPYQFYRSALRMARAPQMRFVRHGCVDGSLDLFEFPRLPGVPTLVTVAHPQPAGAQPVGGLRAEELLREKALRAIFQQGFFKVRGQKLRDYRVDRTWCTCPTGWVFTLPARYVRCRVMDAVRRRIEGAEASALFEQWLAA